MRLSATTADSGRDIQSGAATDTDWESATQGDRSPGTGVLYSSTCLVGLEWHRLGSSPRSVAQSRRPSEAPDDFAGPAVELEKQRMRRRCGPSGLPEETTHYT
ncbi:hypothetical protein NDU88_007895 [Pleurodeles waltl]|uniref:Uncharacterized protein n=1 Tax=Pleurodeles waltl TaxID=8319 RepID=A0AAV7VVP7_PLEWA|nr:hypothetical protein NDU88_007895 [Pleurodeles waltl]